MKYLKLFESKNDKLFYDLANELKNSEIWKNINPIDVDIENEYEYNLNKDLKIRVLNFEDRREFLFYIIENGVYSYIDEYPNTYNKLYPQYKILDRIIKICEESILLLGREILYPNLKEFTYIFSEYIEEYNYELEDYTFGFIGLNEYKKTQNKNIGDFLDLDTYQIFNHTSKKTPVYMAYFYTKKSKKTNFYDIVDDFDSFEKRLKIMGFDKIKASIYFVDDIDNIFYIILEEK